MVHPKVAQGKAGYQDLSFGNPTAPVSTKSPNLSANDAVPLGENTSNLTYPTSSFLNNNYELVTDIFLI